LLGLAGAAGEINALPGNPCHDFEANLRAVYTNI